MGDFLYNYYISMYSFHRSVSTRSVPLRVRFFMVFSCLVMCTALNDLFTPDLSGNGYYIKEILTIQA